MKDKAKHKRATELYRHAILKRDLWTCQRPDCHNEATDAHHIVHKTQSEGLRWSLDNGVALCRSCHMLDGNANGELPKWCVRHIGLDKYQELRMMRQQVAMIDIDEVIIMLEDYIHAT